MASNSPAPEDGEPTVFQDAVKDTVTTIDAIAGGILKKRNREALDAMDDMENERDAHTRALDSARQKKRRETVKQQWDELRTRLAAETARANDAEASVEEWKRRLTLADNATADFEKLAAAEKARADDAVAKLATAATAAIAAALENTRVA